MPTWTLAARYERRFRHDVMAHIHAFGDQAPAARPYLHLGATSAFVTDNADLIVMRDGLRLLLGRLIAVLGALEQFATRHAGLPCLAYTHFQPAQLTTVGKRATLWMQDFALDVEEVCRRIETHAAPGLQGHHRHPGLLPGALRQQPREGPGAGPAGHRQARVSGVLSGHRPDLYPQGWTAPCSIR